MKHPFFSIIVPVYNVESYISTCVNSILKQNYVRFEILLINDGSTDNSAKICDDYAALNKEVRVIHQKNGGLSSARNTGLQNAKGNYIWFVDSDDWIAENALEIIAKELNDDIEMLGFYESKYIENEERFIKQKKIIKIETTNGFSYINANDKFVPSVCFYVYNINFINKHGLLFKEKLIHEDDYFSLQCFAKVTQIRKIENVLYYYRIRENSIVTRNVTIEKLNSLLEIVKLCKSLRNSSLGGFFIESRIRTYLNIFFNNLVNFEKKDNKNTIYKLINDSKTIIPKQVLYKNDLKGVAIEKILYNLSGKLYFNYLKYALKK